MNKGTSGLDSLKLLLNKALERPMPVAVGIAVLTLVLASLQFTWAWFVGALLLWILLYPGMFGIRVQRTTPPAASPAPGADINQLQGQYKEQVQHALNTQRSIDAAIAQTQDAGQRRVLADAVRELPELTNSIYSLALKAQSVESAVGSSNPVNKLSDDIKRLEQQIKDSNDEFQKSQYYAAMDGKLQQMQNLTDTTVAIRRWQSQIDNALSTMDTLLSQVLRIKSSEVLSYTGASDELSNSLKREVDSLKAASEAMDSVYKWSA